MPRYRMVENQDLLRIALRAFTPKQISNRYFKDRFKAFAKGRVKQKVRGKGDIHPEIIAMLVKELSEKLELKSRLRKIENGETLDSLTGLYNNRKHFNTVVNKELERYRRSEIPFALLFIDIDNFKSFNDTYGHQVGDEVLKGTAEVLQNNTRHLLDTPFRFGGEELILVCTDVSAKQARKVAEKIRAKIENKDYNGLNVTVSIGIAVSSEHNLTANQLIAQADKAMYTAKASGRNQVVIYNELIFSKDRLAKTV